ncbi:hypothetical protein HGRIS_007660 [Hohenbuehelia grisea]|uniref:Uncharacterized protein n=1 Tax=Hohenbuehelia grisea TaxID=104357 RepID=A0ABR3J5W8_9AGAR
MLGRISRGALSDRAEVRDCSLVFKASFPVRITYTQLQPAVLRPFTGRVRTISMLRHAARRYATVGRQTLLAKPPATPTPTAADISLIDTCIVSELTSSTDEQRGANLPTLVDQYENRRGVVLNTHLPYESRPSAERRVAFNSPEANVALIAHCAHDGTAHKLTLSSGFRLSAPSLSSGESVFVTCAHTLEEICRSSAYLHAVAAARKRKPSESPFDAQPSSGSFVVTGSSGSIELHPIHEVASTLPRFDVLLLTSGSTPLKSLPISPYPGHADTFVRAHFVSHTQPKEPGWTPWIGGTWSKWVRGKILGYRDFAGRETQPGTYDALSHMLFYPPPTAGSSGGPVVDEESGAVVGVMLGTRMDNRVEGVRGWGVPSEVLFEMFQLPGLEGKK